MGVLAHFCVCLHDFLFFSQKNFFLKKKVHFFDTLNKNHFVRHFSECKIKLIFQSKANAVLD